MPQLHCYVPEEIADAIRRRAEAESKSVSAYLGALVRREIGAQDWPEGFFDEVVGRWHGGELVRLPQPPSESRDPM